MALSSLFARGFATCECLPSSNRSIFGHQSFSLGVSPESLSLRPSSRCLDCINSSVSSTNVEVFAGNAGVPKISGQVCLHLSALAHILFLTPGHSKGKIGAQTRRKRMIRSGGINRRACLVRQTEVSRLLQSTRNLSTAQIAIK